jgi:hypothetical protein
MELTNTLRPPSTSAMGLVFFGASGDLFVMSEADDATMIRIYRTENATQRGNTANAQAGVIASAVRFVAKAVMTGGQVGGFPPTSAKSLDSVRGKIATSEGIGWSIVLEFLKGISGITKNVVEQQLANLKASGHYSRIISEIKAEIDHERKEALKALARAEADSVKSGPYRK